MGFKCGLVGLPNVGKSTLFNAFLGTAVAQSANYPFCTIEPNIGTVAVPDERIEKLVEIAHSKKIIPSSLSFVDIAGLVAGASDGAGLGNRFLSHIREVDIICHVVRCFDEDNIIHVNNAVNPVSDAETILTEMMLSDLESVTQRLNKKTKNATDPLAKTQIDILSKVQTLLENGQPASRFTGTLEEVQLLSKMQLLTTKPMLYVCNTDEESLAKGGGKYCEAIRHFAHDSPVLTICAQTECDIACLSPEEKKEYLLSIGSQQGGLDQIIRTGYTMLDLLTFFTVGPQECRAWSFLKGTCAPQAAGIIHSDFEKGFIASETISYNDYIQYGGEHGCSEAGKVRLEGRNYVVQDGDIIHFRFNV